jgi:hypothetical protein
MLPNNRLSKPARTRVGLALAILATGPRVTAQEVSDDFASPLFGLATAPDGSLLVADAGAGIVELRRGASGLVAALPGVTDIAPIGRGVMWAVTGEAREDPSMFPQAQKLFRVSRGVTREIADLWAFEMAHNPDGTDVVSNPFDVAALGGGGPWG